MSRKVSNNIREEVLRKQNNKCKHCHKDLVPMTTHFDHIHQYSEGGDNDVRNIEALCSGCHDIKSRTETRARANRARINKKKEKEDKAHGRTGVYIPEMKIPKLDIPRLEIPKLDMGI